MITSKGKAQFASLAKKPGFKKAMKRYGKGNLHSGSPKGAIVTNPSQARAIAASEASENASGKC